MIETIISGIAIATSVGVGAGVYYKLGTLSEKVDFIYNNIDICLKFKNGKKYRK